MAFDEGLAERIRVQLHAASGVSERKMFGGLCFLSRGHMCAGIVGDRLMVRVGAEGYESALQRPHVTQMDFTGRAMRGMVYVEPEGIADDDELAAWLQLGVDHARSLPAKTP